MDDFWPELTFLFVGFLLGVIPAIVRHGFAMVGYCKAIREVLNSIRRDAETYLKDGYQAPLYRVAADYYRDTLAALMHEGGLNSEEFQALLDFGSQAEQMNRGLEQIQGYVAQDKHRLRDRENKRILIKTYQLVRHDKAQEHGYKDDAGNGFTVFDTAEIRIDSLCRISWFRWLLRRI